MNTNEVFRRYWRIPLVALLAGALAFAASFVVGSTYESSTRLLVHGRDATFLTSTGQDLSAQPGVVDSSLSQALLSTYAGIATSRSVATDIVGELSLDTQPASTSVYAPLTQAAAWAYRCGRAFLTSGFCAKVDPLEKAILEVQEGITAQPTGTNSGADAGQQASYVLEVTASGNSPEQAKAVTDALANELVSLSNDRFKRDADANVVALQKQVKIAQTEVQEATAQVSAYQTKHGISVGDAKQVLSAGTIETVRSDLLKARADLADTEAQLASIEGSLANIPRDERTKETIVTGRSTTETNTQGANSVYNDLLSKLNGLKAQEAGQSARVDRLQKQVDAAKPLAKNGPLAELAVLQQGADLASQDLRDLTTLLQKSRTNAAQGAVDLSRLDQASQPSYPSKPKRYIYLALGLLIGGLAGALLTARIGTEPRTSDEETGGPDDAGSAGGDDADTAELPPVVAPQPDLVLTGQTNGHRPGLTHLDTNGHRPDGSVRRSQ
ncbi:MAG TPA: Wzz/FepE/Etk N-terminal domain-containing protein [Propionibacteriaceae bacterium]